MSPANNDETREVDGTSAQKRTSAATSARTEKKSNVFGDFELKKMLGKGGMGEVYLAHQVSLDRTCAIKVMSKEFNENQRFVDRFQREAKTMAKLDHHPNIVRVFAVGQERGRHFVAMEFVDGSSMEAWLRKLGKLSIGDALHVLTVCTQALLAAHELKIIHRDIKPDNILLTNGGLVKVADLGLAKQVDDDQSVTKTGTGMGTPHYMPPEQARNAKYVDHRSDIYALGCMMFRFLTGKLPFTADSTIELIKMKEAADQPPSAKKLNPEIPQGLDDVVSLMIMKNPDQRYQSCEDLLKAINSLTVRPNESLEFITSDRKAVLGNSGSSYPSTASVVMTNPNLQSRTQSKTQAPKKKPVSNLWIVKYPTEDGRIKTLKLSTAKVQTLFQHGTIDLRAKLARDGTDEFVPIAQVREFDTLASKQQTKIVAESRGRDLTDAYAKIDKDYQRQKFMRFWKAIAANLFGWVGLIIWLGLACGLLFLFWKYLPDFIRLGFDEIAKSVGLIKDAAK